MKTLAIAIYVLAAAEVFKTIYLGRKITMSTVTAAQALTDLQNLVTALTTAIQNASTEFSTLLQNIQNANGVNPGAVDVLVGKGQSLVSNLNAAVAAAQSATAGISVAISPTTATVAPGGSQTFSATVTNDSANAGVTWAVATGGQGSVTSAGVYSAPAGAIPGTDQVVATSVTDATKSASAAVTIS